MMFNNHRKAQQINPLKKALQIEPLKKALQIEPPEEIDKPYLTKLGRPGYSFVRRLDREQRKYEATVCCVRHCVATC